MKTIRNLLMVTVLALSVIAIAAVTAYAAGAPTTFSGLITDRENLPLLSGTIRITLTNVIGQEITSANGTIGPDGRYAVTVPNYVDTCGIVHFVVSYGGNTCEKESTMGCYLSGKSYNVDLQYADIDTAPPSPAPMLNALAAAPSQELPASSTPSPSPSNLQATGSPTFSPGGNGSSNESGNQTMQLVTPAPGNSSVTPEVSDSNATSGDRSQNASGSQSGVMGTPFPGALVTLLIAGGVCALISQHRRS